VRRSTTAHLKRESDEKRDESRSVEQDGIVTKVKRKKALTGGETTKDYRRSIPDPFWIGEDVTKELFVWTAVKRAKGSKYRGGR
jgi:hypothetical protein